MKRLAVGGPSAESRLMRDRHWDWFNDVAFTRLEPGASAIVVMARWHPDDLAGRLIAQGWQELRLPALSDADEPLWPARWPAEKLHEIRAQVGEYTWSSLYQGRPRSRGGAVFSGVSLYDTAPDGLKVAIGVDLAYSARTQADYSVAVVLGRRGDEHFVMDVCRAQTRAPDFAETLKALVKAHPGAPVLWYAAGTEKGTADFLTSLGVRLTVEPPKGDKFVRAQPVAAAWNAGRVQVPRGAKWADAFVSELADFTGVNDAHDDQVDALAAAYDLLQAKKSDLDWLKGLAKR